MCDLSSAARPSATPGASGTSGGASTSGVATCCPDAAEFTKLRKRTDYFGFDDKTDMVATGVDPYWVAQPGSAPSKKMTRDGAVWLSLEKGKTTKARIDFTNNTGCISNCTYEVRPANVATVLSATITTNRAEFEIKGDRAGDATVVVVCNGNDIGWVHVACYNTLTFRVGMCKINQTLTTGTGAAAVSTLTLPNTAMNVATYQAFFDDAWRDAAVNVTLTALADHNVPAATDISAGGGFWDANGTLASTHFFANSATGVYPVTDAIQAAVQRANPGYDKYLFLMPQPGTRSAGTSYINGFSRGIGGAYAIFFNIDSGTFSTAAHEFGHMVNLRHPNDSKGTSQFPTHLRAPTTGASKNVPANDTLNLMGYGGPRPSRKRLRYKQWEAVSGR